MQLHCGLIHSWLEANFTLILEVLLKLILSHMIAFVIMMLVYKALIEFIIYETLNENGSRIRLILGYIRYMCVWTFIVSKFWVC